MGQKALVDPNLDSLIRHLSQQKVQSSVSRANNRGVPWMRPKLDDSDWDGSLQTEGALIDIHDAFNTDKAEEALIEAFDASDPGNSSDGIVLSLQIDYAAQAERAFRARTTQSFTRSLAHTSARDKGHGQQSGALVGQALDYFTHIIKQGSEGSGGAI
jgi:hypothetical protein